MECTHRLGGREDKGDKLVRTTSDKLVRTASKVSAPRAFTTHPLAVSACSSPPSLPGSLVNGLLEQFAGGDAYLDIWP